MTKSFPNAKKPAKTEPKKTSVKSVAIALLVAAKSKAVSVIDMIEACYGDRHHKDHAAAINGVIKGIEADVGAGKLKGKLIKAGKGRDATYALATRRGK